MDTLEDARWDAVKNRDNAMTGLFVYAVKTTGVFCRPGCASRLALRTNVEFFATPAMALAKDYRACKRCRPGQDAPSDESIAAVIDVCRKLEQCTSLPDVAKMASRLGYSERHLRRRFREVVGVSMGSYVRAQQALRARAALRAGTSVTQSVIEAGFGSSRAFYEHGATRLGMTPGRYRDAGRGERISYTTILTPIGVVLAASTNKGVCAVMVGPDEVLLTKELTTEFANATLERDDEGLHAVATVLAASVKGEADSTQLPLDLEGTAFQIRVWETLRLIPAGQTRTYSQVAQLIGSPRAVRAVGTACAKNPVALTVPCHRVIRQDGSLGGYRWGLDVKEALLSAESK
jgi:AraC family transcriptional regulator, regulatory protein of adaptative response / methylated-DNA-[protein]-cysteine methyltransferase